MRGMHYFKWIGLSLLLSAQACMAAQPKFSFMLIERASPVIQNEEATEARYLVTNNTQITRTLTMVPKPGVAQVLIEPKCGITFTLAPGASCVLHLVIVSPQVGSGVFSGPVVCKTYLPNSTIPDSSLCSQPAQADQLNVRVVA